MKKDYDDLEKDADKVADMCNQLCDDVDKLEVISDKGVFANFIMNLQDLDGKQTGFLEELWDVRFDEIEVETDKSCKVIFSDGIEVIT